MDTLTMILSAVSMAELAGLITTIALLRPNRNKAQEEARRIHAEVAQAEIENDERMTKIFMETLLNPLREEMAALRKEVAALKRAIQRANTCRYKDECPVLEHMQEKKD